MTKDGAHDKPVWRGNLPRALSELVPALTRPVFRRRSPAGAALMADWPSVVGPALAAQTEPRKLSAGTLTIGCAGPVALELAHLQTALLERINTHVGQKLVTTLRFVQVPLAPRPTRAARKTVAPVAVEGVQPEALNEALARLRAAIEGAAEPR